MVFWVILECISKLGTLGPGAFIIMHAYSDTIPYAFIMRSVLSCYLSVIHELIFVSELGHGERQLGLCPWTTLIMFFVALCYNLFNTCYISPHPSFETHLKTQSQSS